MKDWDVAFGDVGEVEVNNGEELVKLIEASIVNNPDKIASVDDLK